jgi:hypothetical protein
MAIGICLQCQHRFVIEDARSYQRTCPVCLQPTQLSDAAAAPPMTALPAHKDQGRWIHDVPLAADQLGQRVRTALAEAAYHRSVVQALRQAARARRGERERAGEPPRTTGSAPDGPEAPAGAMRDSGNGSPQASGLLERAQRSCLEAKILHGQFRVAQENRRASRDPLAVLPPLEYRLLPPHSPLQTLVGRGGPDEAPWSAAPSTLPSTTVFVWGYDPPRTLLCREQFDESAEAARFAAESGWEASREGAWAKETTVRAGLTETLRQLEPVLRQDPAVVGWGAQMRRSGEYDA